MEVTARVELYGLCFPMVFEGPPWSEYDPSRNRSSGDRNPGAHIVDLQVDDSCTLGEVIDRAADEFGIHLSADSHFGNNVARAISGVAFYRAGDEALADLPYDRFARRWPVVDEQGRLWFVDFCEATMAGLCRASAVGAVDGDVLRPYFRATVPQGSPAVLGDWAYLVQAVAAVWRALKSAEPLGTLTLLGLVPWKRLMRKWTKPLYERGIGTGQLSVVLARCEWDVDTAAKLLDMTPNEVAQFLAVLGYRLDDCGIWRKSQDEQGQLLQLAFDIAEQTQWLHREARDVEVKTLGRIVVKMHQETGKVPSVDEVKAARGAELERSRARRHRRA